jgi:hypothetical protein
MAVFQKAGVGQPDRTVPWMPFDEVVVSGAHRFTTLVDAPNQFPFRCASTLLGEPLVFQDPAVNLLSRRLVLLEQTLVFDFHRVVGLSGNRLGNNRIGDQGVGWGSGYDEPSKQQRADG